jgi:hypothetical protein
MESSGEMLTSDFNILVASIAVTGPAYGFEKI